MYMGEHSANRSVVIRWRLAAVSEGPAVGEGDLQVAACVEHLDLRPPSPALKQEVDMPLADTESLYLDAFQPVG